MTDLLFVNASQVVTCAGPARARKGSEMADAGVLSNVAVAVSAGKIAALGKAADLVAAYGGFAVVDCRGGVLTPGLVDSHTHAVFGRPRYEEHELRALGHDYMEIAKRGGGIHASVADFHERPEDELYDLSVARLEHLTSHGTTTVEIKTGYGLSLEDELKALRVIGRLASQLGVRVVPTWLGAHEIPLDFRQGTSRRAELLELLTDEMLPQVQRQGIARFADVFCEPGVFTIDESRRILLASKNAGLGVKIHADELEPHGGAELAVELGATSADHLAAISDSGIDAIARSGVVATLLPGTMLFLGKPRQAPARSLIDAGAAVALATDFNPGTSPGVNFPLMLTLGVSQLRMTVSEAIIAATVNGAAALGLAAETGQIAAGFSADLALFDIGDYRELPYWYGARLCVGAWRAGVACRPYEAEGKLKSLYAHPEARPRGG
ncbi:MAG TPA: imidazolonepropionase [Gemmatimonadaceae bacterium]|nr:imidazolonepropionase [Gemmatimonadaceae bacterium]